MCNHSPRHLILNRNSCNVKCKQLGSSMKKNCASKKWANFYLTNAHTYSANAGKPAAACCTANNKTCLKNRIFFLSLFYRCWSLSDFITTAAHSTREGFFLYLSSFLKKSSEVSVIVGFQAENLARLVREL